MPRYLWGRLPRYLWAVPATPYLPADARTASHVLSRSASRLATSAPLGRVGRFSSKHTSIASRCSSLAFRYSLNACKCLSNTTVKSFGQNRRSIALSSRNPRWADLWFLAMASWPILAAPMGSCPSNPPPNVCHPNFRSIRSLSDSAARSVISTSVAFARSITCCTPVFLLSSQPTEQLSSTSVRQSKRIPKDVHILTTSEGCEHIRRTRCRTARLKQ